MYLGKKPSAQYLTALMAFVLRQHYNQDVTQ